MGPIRTEKPSKAAHLHTNSKKHYREDHKRRPRSHENEASSSALPGVQKLKSQLRQARRLLAKDNLAPDVRVQTERRLKSLEADLAKAELSKKERTMALRYHKVKFFERQKVVRKINQVKRQLNEAENGGTEAKQLQASLRDLRIDLNYILHYPKLEKYVSIFPPEVRHKFQSSGPSESKLDPPEDRSVTDATRAEMRRWVRERMESCELSAEPEVNLHADQGKRPQRVGGDRQPTVGTGRKKAKSDDGTLQIADERDEFFDMGGDDNEDEDEDDSGGDVSES